MRLFSWKKVVDEREEMEMMRIEHFMYWFVFWALLLSIFVQLLFMGAGFKQVAGEWIVFISMAVCTVIVELKGGHFDYCFLPGWKAYLLYSVLAAAGVIAITLLRGILRGYYHSTSDAVLTIMITGVFAGAVTYLCLVAAGTFVKYRRKKLEEKYDEEE